MRRAAAFVLGTITGTSLLVAAKLGNTTLDGDASNAGDASGTGAVVVGGDPGTTGPQAGGGPTRPGAPATSTRPGQPGPTGTGHPTSVPTTTKPGSTPTHTSTPTPTQTPTHTGYTDGRYTASAQVSRSHGTLSMTVTISGGRITAVSASETDDRNCYHSACATLTSEALQAQSANIHAVSRATQTSNAYKAALQAILNKA